MIDDTALLERYSRTGDAEAFAQLVQRYARMVYGTGLRITGNPQEAEDITQECLLELARKSGSVMSSLPGWLHKVARNRALNAITKNATQRRYEAEAAAETTDPPGPSWAEIAPLVDEAVERLPDLLREPVILHYFQGLTQAETALVLGVDQSTISRNLAKAVVSLRSDLEKTGIVVTVGALAVLLTDKCATSAPAAIMAALGKIAISGIRSGAGAGSSAATGGLFAALAAELETVAGKIALVSALLVASLIVGQQVYTRGVASSALTPVAQATPAATSDKGLLKRIKAGLNQRYASIRSAKGSLVLSTTTANSGKESTYEREIRVRSKGIRFWIWAEAKSNAVGYEGSYDGKKTIEWMRMGSYTPVKIYAGRRSTTCGEYDLFVDPRKHGIMRITDDSNISIAGKEELNGEECVIVESKSQFPGYDKKHYIRMRMWVDTVKGFTVPKLLIWTGDGTKEYFVSEHTTQVKDYGRGLWGPARSTRTDYELDGTVRDRWVVTYDPNFQLNAPVSEEELTLTLPSGTHVYDETLKKEYTVQ